MNTSESNRSARTSRGRRSPAPRGQDRREGLGVVSTGLLSVGLGAILALAQLPGVPSAQAGGKPCARAEFQTTFVKEACAKGGQKGAKKAMKDWVKKAKKKKAGLECATCHSDMAPDYKLKPEGLKLFQELGGK